jgi:hypothetical protein
MKRDKAKWIQAWRITGNIDTAMLKINKRLRKKFNWKLLKRHDQLQITKERIKLKYGV